MRAIRSAAVVLAITTIPMAAVAQSRETLTLTAAPMRLGLGGTDLSGIAPATAVELQVRYSADPQRRGSIAFGYHWSSHGVDGGEIKVKGLFIEPRYTVTHAASVVAPFVTARYSSVMLRGPALAVFGSAIGVGAGLVMKASSRVQLETAFGVSLMFFPKTGYTPSANGTNSMMRLGVGVNL